MFSGVCDLSGQLRVLQGGRRNTNLETLQRLDDELRTMIDTYPSLEFLRIKNGRMAENSDERSQPTGDYQKRTS